jgi:putative ABC transport system permease protein
VVYTAADKILIEPLPYKDPEDLYMVWCNCSKDLTHLMLTPQQIEGLRGAGGVIEAAAGLDFGGAVLLPGDSGDAVRIQYLSASINLFDMLGVKPALGRGFSESDAMPKAPLVGVLSDRLWKQLGGDSEIVGTRLEISTIPFTVVGVMPPGFEFGGSDSDMKPGIFFPDEFSRDTSGSSYRAIIRARHGVPPEEVQWQVDAVGRFVDGQQNKSGSTVYPVGIQTEMVRDVRPALVALSFAGVFLVFILTVNLASLLLARAVERERELAVSRAVGASATAIVRATLFEGGMLGLAGGIAGALAGIWGTRLLVALGPADLPRREFIAMDREAAIIVISVGTALGLLASAVPATWAARASLSTLMSASSVRGSAGSSRMRRGLIVIQVALSLVLLSSAGLVVASFQRLLQADPGFRSTGVLTFELGLGGRGPFNTTADMYAFIDRVDDAVRVLPGVRAVSATSRLPLAGAQEVSSVEIPGAPGNTGDPKIDRRTVNLLFARAGYAETIGMRLIEGRDFDIKPREGVLEALIDRHLARQFFPNRSAVGATLRTIGRVMTVTGVVDQARLSKLHTDDSMPHVFLRVEDNPNRRAGFYVVRSDRDPLALIPEIREAIRQVDRRVAISNVRTLDEIVSEKRSEARISAVMIGGLALGALLLVAMGLFGVIAGSVARRRGELAVRLAMGATHSRVIRMVVGEGLRLVVVGLLLGIPGIYMAGQAIGGLLVGISPFDKLTLGLVAAGLSAVTLIACYLAARRVTTIEPERLLREGG